MRSYRREITPLLWTLVSSILSNSVLGGSDRKCWKFFLVKSEKVSLMRHASYSYPISCTFQPDKSSLHRTNGQDGCGQYWVQKQPDRDCLWDYIALWWSHNKYDLGKVSVWGGRACDAHWEQEQSFQNYSGNNNVISRYKQRGKKTLCKYNVYMIPLYWWEIEYSA